MLKITVKDPSEFERAFRSLTPNFRNQERLPPRLWKAALLGEGWSGLRVSLAFHVWRTCATETFSDPIRGWSLRP